jgi:pyruvate formate lyase activating enzyme
MKEARLYESLPRHQARCHVCPRRCILPEGKSGYCETRTNQGGKVFSRIYGKIGSLALSPIEKKPLYHFYPGSLWLSLGSYGCNFRCPGCQNWELAHGDVEKEAGRERFIGPDELVEMARKGRCKGISWTYNEPTLWLEYVVDGARLAKENGLLTNWVTNGYMTDEALDLIGPFLDSFRVDLKGFSREVYRSLAHIDDFSPVLKAAKGAKEKWGMHVEIITNVIPGINDSQDELCGIATWIGDHLGRDTPWHLTRFHPHFRLSHLPPTPVETLERGRKIGFEAGLHFVYLGNVSGHDGENTYCPGCGKLLIRRHVFDVVENHLRGTLCPGCGTKVPGKF